MAYPKRNAEMNDDNFDSGAANYAPKNGGGMKVLVVVLIIIIIAILGYVGFTMSKGSLGGGSAIAPVSTEWQAVFLTNGQVYFGKVNAVGEKTLNLSDIYYLQIVNKPLQQSQQGGQPVQTQQELTLIKLGNEIHGPQDAMIINTDQVLLTEKLKKDSKVVEAINNYLKDQKAAAPATK